MTSDGDGIDAAPPEPASSVRGIARLHAELASFPATSVTHRTLAVVRTVLPGDPVLPVYATLDEAAGAVFGGMPADLLREARRLCDDPRVDQALFAAKSIDTGDTGLTIVSGVRSALALFFSKGTGRSAALAQQQRTDAALKALALAYVVTRLVPLAPPVRVEVLKSVPAGRQLLAYYGALDIALPLRDEVEAANGTFVADLVRSQGRSLGDKLLGIIGRNGMADAEATLAALTSELDRAALAAVPHTTQLAEQIRSLLPMSATPGDLFDLVAAGADALPCYRYLVARLAIELSMGVAKYEAMPDVTLPDSPAAAPTVPTPAPPPVPPGLRTDTVIPGLAAAEPAPQPAADTADAEPTAEATAETTAETTAEVTADVPAEPTAEVPDDDPPAPEPEDAPPPPEARRAWPTEALPEDRRLRGVFAQNLGGTPVWRVFTVEGVYSDAPLPAPDVGWDDHAARGNRVGLYHRDGNTVRVVVDGEAPAPPFSVERDPSGTALILDGQRWPRADWDLTGRAMGGQWRAADGTELALSQAGEATLGGRSGTYTLGVGQITLRFADGTTRTLSLLSDLAPSSRRPARLWLGGAAFTLNPG